MTYLPAYKTSNCSFCDNKDCPCRKVKRDYYCLAKCYPALKGKEQLEKVKKRQAIERDKSKIRTLINTPVNKEVKENDKLYKAQEDLFWLSAEKEIAKHPFCVECGAAVPDKKWHFKLNTFVPTKQYYRAATSHILFKSIFPSVAFNLNNWLILPAGCCHDKTHRLDTFSKMKCFGQAVKQFRKFEHLITEKHKLLDEFKRLADEYEGQEFMRKEQLKTEI